ncbi:hypothetical protein HMPREF9062_0214 [Actinomyces sp. oral taxon 448 str. F0400]|nr:hypothetical protein HMPREF9062_0214 [Actinomyces sp. oral taxon 448 str. F0400]
MRCSCRCGHRDHDGGRGSRASARLGPRRRGCAPSIRGVSGTRGIGNAARGRGSRAHGEYSPCACAPIPPPTRGPRPATSLL